MYVVKGNYIFFHIPKTGGKSLYQYFLRRDMLEFANEHGKYLDFFRVKEKRSLKPIGHETFLHFQNINDAIKKDPTLKAHDGSFKWGEETSAMISLFQNISQDPYLISKNYKLFATIRNPIDWYISFYNHNNGGWVKHDQPNSFVNICNILNFEEFIEKFVEKANIGLYTKFVCSFILPADIGINSAAKDRKKEYLYNNFDELCPPITFLKIENIKEEMIKHVPEVCSDLENSEFLHENKGVAGAYELREKYLEFFEKSRELLLQKEDIIREKDKLIFEKAGY
tara:strand:- start:379 stop:1227 length:849 start_codon:yes stop_codon:yes gene_type:complete